MQTETVPCDYSAAQREYERREAEAREFADLEEGNRQHARESFDGALKVGTQAPVWAPGPGSQGLRRTKPLHDIVSLQADMSAVTALLLAARASQDPTVKALADAVLDQVRESHADDCADAGLF